LSRQFIATIGTFEATRFFFFRVLDIFLKQQPKYVLSCVLTKFVVPLTQAKEQFF